MIKYEGLDGFDSTPEHICVILSIMLLLFQAGIVELTATLCSGDEEETEVHD